MKQKNAVDLLAKTKGKEKEVISNYTELINVLAKELMKLKLENFDTNDLYSITMEMSKNASNVSMLEFLLSNYTNALDAAITGIGHAPRWHKAQFTTGISS